jgi:hypothetical protein
MMGWQQCGMSLISACAPGGPTFREAVWPCGLKQRHCTTTVVAMSDLYVLTHSWKHPAADIIIWDLETRSLLHRLQLQKVGGGWLGGGLPVVKWWNSVQ